MATLSCWFVGLLLMTAQTQVPAEPWVYVRNAAGETVGSFVAQEQPFRIGMHGRVGEEEDFRDSTGRTVKGFEYYGWKIHTGVRIVVIAKVPANQAKTDSFHVAGDPAEARYERVAEFTLKVGESRAVDEQKAFGREQPRIIAIALPKSN